MNHPLTTAQLLALSAEHSRIYHLRLAELDAAIRIMEANPTALTVAEYNDRFRGLQEQRARLVAEWEREQIQH